MSDPQDRAAEHTPGRPKWFVPAMFALAFTLSFILAEVMGPLGAVLGLVLGVSVGWAVSKWVLNGDGQ